MAKTTEQLLQQAVQIRDEQANKKNTALRVGTLFSDIIQKQDEDVTALDKSVKDNKEKLTELNAEQKSFITPLVDDYHTGDSVEGNIHNGVILLNTGEVNTSEAESYGIYVFPVSARNRYIIKGNLNFFNSYSAIGFSEKETLTKGDKFIPLISATGNLREYAYIYMPTSDGYIVTSFSGSGKIDVYNLKGDVIKNALSDIKSNEQKINITESDLQQIKTDFYENVTTPISKEGEIKGFMSSAGTITDYASSQILYFPVEKNKSYKITLSNWFCYKTYYTIGFSDTIPEYGGTAQKIYMHDTTGVVSSIIQDYIPSKDGYILLGRWSGEYIVDVLENKPKEFGVEINETPLPIPNIILSGSSITWGDGALDGSMVGFVDKFVKNEKAKTLLHSELTYSEKPEIFANALQYMGESSVLSGLSKKITFEMFGDEVSICHTRKRISDYGVMQIKADGEVIGQFDNKNLINSETETFNGDNLKNVELKHPCTYNHRITINDSQVLSNIVIASKVGQTIKTEDAIVYRKLNKSGEPTHVVSFNENLGSITKAVVEYDYGRIIAHERSTVGQLNDGITNETYFGLGSTSYDPDHPISGGPSSGMEFRAIDDRAFYTYRFNESKKRKFEIEIIGGSNPYIAINYVTNRRFRLMNAGIGGWTVANLNKTDNINNLTQFYKWFMPDVVFQESATNDDWNNSIRRIQKTISGVTKEELVKMYSFEISKVTYQSDSDDYEVVSCNGEIQEIDRYYLKSADIIGTETKVGDIVRIGNYHGDNRQVVVRKISEVDTEQGIVRWKEPINADNILNIDSLSDLVGANINIRNLDNYKTQYKQFIENVRSISPQAKIVIVANGLSMYGLRQLWGYDIIHRELCNEYPNVYYCDVTNWLYDTMQSYISGSNKEDIEANGSSEYELSFKGNNYAWQGFKVIVNGVDVYGTDCYIESGWYYHADKNKSGAELDKTLLYRKDGQTDTQPYKMKLVFTRNAPSSGNITIMYADGSWSSDFCHPSDDGKRMYSQMYSAFL